MGRFHVATITPTKEALIADWLPRQEWGPSADADLTFIGSYRFDDPDGDVGMETFLVESGETIYQVPLTYRDTPLASGPGLITTVEHSALGTRWVYDGLRDERYVTMSAAVTMTGQGEALGMALHEGRWFIAPTRVRISGGGWDLRRVPVDAFELQTDGVQTAVLQNDGFRLRFHRRPLPGAKPPIGLVATWEGGRSPVVLAEVNVDHRARVAFIDDYDEHARLDQGGEDERRRPEHAFGEERGFRATDKCLD